MFQVWYAVVQQLAGKHRAVNTAMWSEAVFLQPRQIKDSVVRDPVAITVFKKVIQLAHAVFINLEQVDYNNGFRRLRPELQKPELAHFRLQLERFRVERNHSRVVYFVEVLDAEIGCVSHAFS